MLRKISLASIALNVGGVLTVVAFIAYVTHNATLNLAGMFYGIPIFLGGLAFKITELKPVPFSQATSPDVLALRNQQATPTQQQVRKDVTRYRYGQEAHLDEALQRLGLSPTDEERPILIGLREVAIDGFYALVLEFDSPLIPFSVWQEKQEKLAKFFGPGIRAEVTQLEENRVDVALIALT
jgi:hypothetical protein